MTEKTNRNILIISLNQEDVITLQLKKPSPSEKGEAKIIAEQKWNDQQNISRELLAKIDGFLRANNSTVRDLQKVEAKIAPGQKYTTARIIKITAKTLNHALKASKKN